MTPRSKITHVGQPVSTYKPNDPSKSKRSIGIDSARTNEQLIILKAAGAKKQSPDNGMLQVTGQGAAHQSSQSRELTDSEKRKREHADLFRSQHRFPAIADDVPMNMMHEGDPSKVHHNMTTVKKQSNISTGSDVLAQINAMSSPGVAENLLNASHETLQKV